MTQLSARVSELLQRRAFAHAADDPRLIETHISWVILAGEYAYKLRKPVNFGFLDFSTLEKRRADCEAEVALNRRLCSDLYLGVVEVVERPDGSLAFGGSGTPVEPAVCMRRLPETSMLPILLERGRVDEHLMQRIAQRLAQFHAGAATGPGIDEYGDVALIRANWAENFSQVDAGGLDPFTRLALQSYVRRFLDDNVSLFEGRIASGRIRDGHGDLHAGSVCATRRQLYLFDCIEFNARFRCADVAAEVAFLAMDLEHFGRADLASAFVDAYVRASNDVDLLRLLEFYKCYRACVRGKVLRFRLSEPGLDAATSARLASDARAYFNLAYAIASPVDRPALVVVMGLPASGKTTFAHALASHLGLIHLSSEVTRKQLPGVRPTLHAPDPFEDGMYSRASSRRTYAAMRRKAARWLRRGKSVVLDATYGQRAERAAVRQLARRAGALVSFVLCRADESVFRARLAERANDPRSTLDARPEIWPALRKAFSEPGEIQKVRCVDTTIPVDSQVEKIISEMFTQHAQEVAA